MYRRRVASLRSAADPVLQLGTLLRSVATRRQSERDNRLSVRQLEGTSTELAGLPAGLAVRWLGTAGYAISFEGHRLLIDPYATRAPLHDVLRRRVLHPDRGAIDTSLPVADAVLVGHTHFDHVLDAPFVAARDRCPVYGSQSVAHLMGLYGRAEQAVVVEAYQVYEIGPFAVTFVPSVHSKLLLGLKVNSSGPITCDHLDGLHAGAYRCDQVWGIHIAVGGVTFYHQGSADVVDEAVRHRGVDYFLCGIAGRQFSPGYVERVLRLLEPRVVVPNHYDNFFSPLDAPMEFTVGVDIGGFAEEVAAVSADFEVHALPLTATGRGRAIPAAP